MKRALTLREPTVTDAPRSGSSATSSTSPSPSMNRWVAQRRPVFMAVAVVVAICLACAGLRWLGPINPDVSMMQYPGTQTAVFIDLHDNSRLGVEVVAVDLQVDPDHTIGGAVLPVVSSVSVDSAGGGQLSPTLPVQLPGGSAVVLTVQLRLDGCLPGGQVQPYRLRVRYRTAVGTEQSLPDGGSSGAGACPDVLPTGEQPADVAAASAGVHDAFTTVYNADNAVPARTDRIDDSSGVAAATAAALQGPYASTVASVQIAVREVSFDRPDHAWVRYDLLPYGLGNRIGNARLVDGQWKVTRETVCRDLELAFAPCP